jgi:hypothetical protein
MNKGKLISMRVPLMAWGFTQERLSSKTHPRRFMKTKYGFYSLDKYTHLKQSLMKYAGEVAIQRNMGNLENY